MQATINKMVTLKVVECVRCGVSFALPQSLYDHLSRLGGFYHCPAGHTQGWDEGQAARDEKDLKRQLTEEAKRREILETELRNLRVQTDLRVNAMNKEAANIHTRVSNGVCPCCNRTFKQLQAHMKNKHPEYVANKGE